MFPKYPCLISLAPQLSTIGNNGRDEAYKNTFGYCGKWILNEKLLEPMGIDVSTLQKVREFSPIFASSRL